MSLTWPELVIQVAAPTARTVAGRISVSGDATDGGWFDVAVRLAADPTQIAYRIEGSDGTVALATGGVEVRRDGDEVRLSTLHRLPDVAGLLGPWDPDAGDFSRAVARPTATEALGRPAWQLALRPPPHKAGPLLLTVDAATGLRLRLNNPAAGMRHEWEWLIVDGPFAEPDLASLGEVTADDRLPDRWQRLERLWADRQLPTLTTWPSGYRATWFAGSRGWLSAVDTATGPPVLLAHASAGEPLPAPDDIEMLPEARRYDWTDDRGDWALWSPRPLDDAELDRVRRSVR